MVRKGSKGHDETPAAARGPDTAGPGSDDAEAFELAFERAAVGMGIAGLDERILRINAAACEFLGYTREQLLGRGVADITHPDDLERDRRERAALLSGDQSVARFTKRYVRADGGVSLGELSVSLVRGRRGEPLCYLCQIVDVTRLRLAEQALTRSEDRYRLATEAGGVAAWRSPFGRPEVESGGALESLLGYREGEVQDWSQVTHPEERENIGELWRRMERGDIERYELERRMLHRDGSVRWFLVRGQVRRDPSGRPAEVVGTALDVTAHKLAEERLRRLNRLLEMLRRAGDAASSLGEQGELLCEACLIAVEAGGLRLAWVGMVSPQGTQVLVAAEHGEGVGYTQGIRIDVREEVPEGRGPTGTAIRSGQPVVCPDIAADPRMAPWQDAARRFGLASSAAVPLRAAGRIVGAINVYAGEPGFFGADEVELVAALAGVISRALDRLDAERRGALAEKARRESEQRYRTLFDSAPEAIALLRAERVLLANAAAARLVGAGAPDELLGRDAWGLAPPGLRETAAAQLAAWADESWDGRAVEIDFPRADGTTVPLEITAAVVEFDGEPAVQVKAKDISKRRRLEQERRRLERQLLQAQRLESVGRLAAGVAHEFNNQLTVVTAYADLACADLAPGDPLLGRLLPIREAADRAASLTRQLLAFGRKQPSEPRVLDFGRMVGSLERMLRRVVGEDVELEISTGADLGAVEADEGQIEQVVMNLVVNARDAMPHGGRLTIATCNLDVGGRKAATDGPLPPGRYVVLSVGDTGCGMDEHTRERIFEPFFTTKEPGRGSGLGLSTVHGIVMQHAGHIRVRSEPGRGTSFEILLPRSDAPVTPRGRRSPSDVPRGAGQTVLVVEDHQGVRALARMILERHGYAVIDAAGASEALDLVARHPGPIDVLLSDVVMPGMDGAALAERMRGLRPDVRVVLCSGHPDRAALEPGAAAGGRPLLRKPYTAEQLLAAVGAALGNPDE
ncbi:MAG: PAS domain S-box protein [Deltaproteobacteria bacterium]|nr:PAS domain S-box protein [Deltaproteobacteria bacterium]